MSQGSFKPIYPNPYIVGNPIRSRDMFFGRVDEFRHISQALDHGQKTALIVLFGERRSGKSSILYQIQNGQLGQAFLPLFIDLQIMAGIANEAEFFGRIITDTGKALGKAGPEIAPYILRPDDSNPAEGFRQYLRALQAHFPGRALLVLIDEYEILENKITEGCLSRHVLTFFGGLLESEQVSFVFTGSRKLELHNAELWGSALLQKATSRKISFLTPDDTARLVTQPLANKVTFAPEVIEQIYALTAGQPFYTQLICQNLVYHLNEVKKYFVDCADLEKVVEGILENPPPQLIFNWGEHAAEHKLMLALLAEFSRKPGRYLSTTSIRYRVQRSKLDLVLNDAKLKTWLTDLCKDEYLLQQDYRFSFRLDLFRRWIRHDHNIWQVKKEIGQEELDRICEKEKEKKEKKKKIIIALERTALAVAVIVVIFLVTWIYNLIFQQQVEVSGNGGPFAVIAVTDGDTVRFHAAKKNAANRYFDEKKLKKGKTYNFTATLPANNETQSKTIVIAKNTTINFNFREYPVLVFTDADSIIAELGEWTIRTKIQNDPWKHTFNVPAGEYTLNVRDASTGELKERQIVVRADENRMELIEIDFDSVFVVTLQANSSFNYHFYGSSGKRGRGISKFSQSDNLYWEKVRGCKTGKYKFTFIDFQAPTSVRQRIDRIMGKDSVIFFGDPQTIQDGSYDFSKDTTIKVEFDYKPKREREKQKPEEPPQPPPRPKYQLKITTRPDSARVILGSMGVGYTSFDTTLIPSIYSITLKKEGYEPLSLTVKLERDTTISRTLKPQIGFVKFKVLNRKNQPVYEAEIFSGEKKLGDTPIIEEKQLQAGIRHVIVKHPEYVTKPDTCLIKPNEHREKTIILEKKP